MKLDNVIRLPSGLIVTKPTTSDWQKAERLTQEQEKLYNQGLRLSNSDEDQGKWIAIQRRVAILEKCKHPLLRIWNIHLAPKPPIAGLHVTPDIIRA